LLFIRAKRESKTIYNLEAFDLSQVEALDSADGDE
jgi:hypothetical protein